MALSEDIKNKVKDYVNSKYDVTEGYTIPGKEDIGFGAKAKKLKQVVVLFTDLRGSKKILSNNSSIDAGRAHKAFLFAAAKCIRDQDGYLRSFNGDSILAFYIGEKAAHRAVRSALKIKGAVDYIVNPELEGKGISRVDFGVGIGIGEINVVKSGIPGEEINQDLLWIGWPTYHAFGYGNKAKRPNNIWISENVFSKIKSDSSLRYSGDKNIWTWSNEKISFGTFKVYMTTYHIKL